MGNEPALVGRLAGDLRDEFEEVLQLAAGADLSQQTPAVGWDIRRTVGHLHATDLSARTAIVDPETFLTERPRRPDEFRAMHKRQLQHLSTFGDAALLVAWRHGLDALLAASLAAPAGTKHPWYGPPLSIASSLTARVMEYWAHGEDIANACGAERKPSSRLRHICHLGVRTYGFSFRNRNLPAPEGEPRMELTSPTGEVVWVWGPDDADDTVRGDALDIAQCFAGPPGAGRAPKNETPGT